jgi:hypothetical protein
MDDDIAPVGRILREGYKLPSGKGYKGINISLCELCNELDSKMDELNVSYLTTVKSFAIGFYYPEATQCFLSTVQNVVPVRNKTRHRSP